MAISPERVILTYEDYLELPNDRNRYEILEGDLAVNPAPTTLHQILLENLAFVLGGLVRKHHLGRILFAPCDVLLSDITIVQPDLLFVSRERMEIVLPRYVEGPPDLVVEVISSTSERTDHTTKKQIYAHHGVPNYWLFDPATRNAWAFVLSRRGYRQSLAVQGDAMFAAAPFRDFPIALATLWS